MFEFAVLANFLVIAAVALWYAFGVRLQNTQTIPKGGIFVWLAINIRDGEYVVYDEGTVSPSEEIKFLERIETNPTPKMGQEQSFRSNQVEFNLQFDYGWRYINRPDPNILRDTQRTALARNVVRAYLEYNEPQEREDVIRQIINQRIEMVGRSLSPEQLTEPRRNPFDLWYKPDGSTETIRPLPLNDNGTIDWLRVNWGKPEEGRGVRILDDDDLILLFSEAVMHGVNHMIRSWGVELNLFNPHEIPYKRPELQVRAEKEYEATRVNATVKELMSQGTTRSREEAALIALGQDDDYAKTVIHRRWQDTVETVVDTAVKTVLKALGK